MSTGAQDWTMSDAARDRVVLTKNDTDGEVNFAGICPLITPAFRLVPNVNRASCRLRHQYQK
jgi:hypothetical protein